MLLRREAPDSTLAGSFMDYAMPRAGHVAVVHHRHTARCPRPPIRLGCGRRARVAPAALGVVVDAIVMLLAEFGMDRS